MYFAILYECFRSNKNHKTERRGYEGGEMVRVCEGGIRKEKFSGYEKGV